jgi:hypothetical protein
MERMQLFQFWGTSTVRQDPTPEAVAGLASTLQIHPAIVAGKLRHERKSYRLLSRLVGTGDVRRQFGWRLTPPVSGRPTLANVASGWRWKALTSQGSTQDRLGVTSLSASASLESYSDLPPFR